MSDSKTDTTGKRSASAIIPCNRPDFLAATLASLKAQSYPIEKIYLVADGIDLSAYVADNVVLVQNESRIGKAGSINKATKLVETELILCVDADTTLGQRSLEIMETHLVDEVQIVLPFLYPVHTLTWIERDRADWYKKSSGSGQTFNVVGCAFLTKRRFLTLHPMPTETMVEDQHMAWLMKKDRLVIFQCQIAPAFTEEPRTARQLFRQMLRWSYGSYELDVIKHHSRKLIPYALVGFFVFLGILAYFSPPFGFSVLIISIIYGYFAFSLRYWPVNGFAFRAIPYTFVYFWASIIAQFLAVRGKRPGW